MTDPVASTAPAPLKLTINPLPQGNAGDSGQKTFFSGDSPSFQDFVDTINPLQHIPVVSTIYQAMTGSTPSAGSKIAGDTLFGGPLGLLASIFGSVVQSATGASVGGNIMAAIEGKPVPALQNGQTAQIAAGSPPDHLSANQRAGYNAYVNASILT